jgi:hypothetical protein
MSVQLVVRDGVPDWWESPDIWVVPGTDPEGAPGAPVAGQTAYLWASVANQGDTDVSMVQVDFWVADPTTQIRRSTANHIGTAFVDVPAGGSQDVLCLVPWAVTMINGGHECVVVAASSSADPLSPTPVDPDLLDPVTYPQIAQRNLSVLAMGMGQAAQLLITLRAGARAGRQTVLHVAPGGELSRELLDSLGLKGGKAAPDKLAFGLSAHPSRGTAEPGTPTHGDAPGERALKVTVPRGTAVGAYLGVTARTPLAEGEYAVLKVAERDGDRTLGGLSLVVVPEGTTKGGA